VNQLTTPRGNEPREHPVVLLVEPSALRRAALARALAAAGFYVRSLESLGTILRPRFAIVNLEDLREKDADTLLAALLGTYLDVPLILRSSDPAHAEAGARILGLNVALSLAKDALERDVVAHVCRWSRSGLAGGNDGRESCERLVPAALKGVPVLAVARDDLGWYETEPENATFLASIDGKRSLEAIAACSGLAPSVVMSVARALVEEGVVVLT
jgi:hypothetical protein